MRIVKPDAIPSGPQSAFYHENQTIEINLEDFDAWYKATYWRNEGGLIHYTSVSWYIQKWLDSAIFMSTDVEANKCE